MKLLLLLPLLLGLPSPLFAGSSTDGYKQEKSCISFSTRDFKPSLWKKENSNSKKWGSYVCEYTLGLSHNCYWSEKAVSYDEAYSDYKDNCKNL